VLHKFNLPAFVTAMAWEKRERGGRYYYRSFRDGERVRKEYVGAGELARITAEGDTIRRTIEQGEREWQRAEVERLEELTAPLVELDEATETLARAALVASGHHRHKGEWRRERST
jgi:hypothetical protein